MRKREKALRRSARIYIYKGLWTAETIKEVCCFNVANAVQACVCLMTGTVGARQGRGALILASIVPLISQNLNNTAQKQLTAGNIEFYMSFLSFKFIFAQIICV